jgi:mono/diheme cytochrome c family protein
MGTNQSESRQRATPRDFAGEWRPPSGSGIRQALMAFVWALLIAAPMLGIGAQMIYSEWRQKEDARLAAIEAAFAYERVVAAEPLAAIPVDDAMHGRDVFMTACVTCHSATGTGVAGLGKNLVQSDFVAAQTDEQLEAFLMVGRPNARPLGMPAKGGRDDLTPEDLRRVAAYVRGLQDPRRMPGLPAYVAAPVAPPTAAETEAALAAAGGDAELAEYIASGTKLFGSTCIACHGAGGVGIKGNGKALARNDFISSLDDDALLAFVKRGRDPGDPKNTTGVAMPPKGGNPALSDDDLLDIIAYLRTLQSGKPSASAAK